MPFVALLIVLRDVDCSLTSRQRSSWETSCTKPCAPPVFLAEHEHGLPHLQDICGNRARTRFWFLSDEHQRPALRITLLSQTAMASLPLLLETLTTQPCLRIGTRHYLVEETLLSHSSWTGLSDWTDFLAPPYGHTIRLHFGTPLVLLPASTAGYFFPVPCQLFATIARCWKDLGGPPLPIPCHDLEPLLGDGSIVLADYRLSGCQILLHGRCHLGFRGSLSYHCRSSLEAVRIMLTALSRFAFFAGIGVGTEQGMGATRISLAQGKEQQCSGLS
jgi:hypothetical protein